MAPILANQPDHPFPPADPAVVAGTKGPGPGASSGGDTGAGNQGAPAGGDGGAAGGGTNARAGSDAGPRPRARRQR